MKYIGSQGFASDIFIDAYPVINYARAGFSSKDKITSKGLYSTINVGYLTEDGIKLPSEYLADIKEAADFAATEAKVISISQDDYIGWYRKYNSIAKEVRNIIKNARQKLRYGATIYDDDFDKKIIAVVGRDIDLVHFYFHKRTRAKQINAYMEKLNTYFPHAKIILGIYNMDRREYEKRSPAAHVEVSMFKRQLKDSMALLNAGKVSGIELFPGGLGNEANVIKNKGIAGESADVFYKMSDVIKEVLK